MTKKAKDRNYLKLRFSDDNLDFGRLIAEQDDKLAQYYVSDQTYLRRARNVDDPAVFFVGPKGIGKSAILQMVRLLRASDENRIVDIRPDDLAFSALANVEANSAILSDAGRNQWLFKALWDYILALEILRREYPSSAALSGWFAKITQGQYEKEARRLLELSEGQGAMSLTSRILQLIQEVELSAEYAGGKLAASVKLDRERKGGTDSFQLLALVNSVAKRLPDSLRHTYYVLIDDLDLYWSDTPTQNTFIAALFTSLRHFSRPPNLKAVVALRENIYDSLPLIDRDKFHDAVCHVRWDYETVREMIEERVIYKLLVNKADIWDGLFPSNAFEAFWSHSSGRPREAIRIATLAAATAAHEGHKSIHAGDLDVAIRSFSHERIREIAGELQYQYPGLEFIIRKMNGWPKEFPFGRIKELVELIGIEVEVGELPATQYAWAAGFASNPIGFADILVRHNVLWIKRSRTDEAQQFNPKNPVEITRESYFAIHPMFGPGLGLIGA